MIDGGMQAIEQCLEDNIPICKTEVFSIGYTIDICEMYEQNAVIVSRISAETHVGVMEEFCEKIEVFPRPYLIDGIKREEYADAARSDFSGMLSYWAEAPYLAKVSKHRTAIAFGRREYSV